MAERNHSLERGRKGHIPTELHEEILLRLPTNDLLNFKCVCKDWLRLISSPQFIQKHLYKSNVCCNAPRFLIRLPSSIIDYNYYANESNIRKIIPCPPGFSRVNTTILGFCDGLIWLLDKSGSNEIGVFNPSTGKSDIRVIDGLDFSTLSSVSWFGRHPSTGEYVLVIGRLLPSPIRVKIEAYEFSSKLKSMMFCSILRSMLCVWDVGTLLHGNLHWRVSELYSEPIWYMVLAYDFEKNEILEFAGPRESYSTLGVVDGCLSAIMKCDEMFELWIMKEYGVEQSWTTCRNIEGCDKCRVPCPLALSWNGRVTVDLDKSKLTEYGLSDKEAAFLKDQRVSSWCLQK